ncbi:TraB/GumN family protein [Dyella psychrodurans]|uniref:TraB/GumN family protein n=1 Tax=Dyella psychrodurans TaxID=1927960 RepID=A0A370XEB4_9GAMM|nr:TraB/GumN family protein [Dyella psychrodurans]RDS86764.1 TraB/GumN family protein [Dyella psychrodurans]
MRTYRRFLVALLPLLFLLCGNVSAHPALWQIKSGNSTIYLFGTVHLLPNDTDWHFPALNQALAQSQTLYIELIDDDQANMASLVMQYGLDTAHPLSTQLTESDNAALARAAQLAGLPGGAATLQPMKPWLAALTLSVAPLLKAGLDPAEGVDKQLKLQMTNAGKPVHGLETAQQQIEFLADLPNSLQLAFLRDTLRDTDKDAAELRSLVDAWKQGNVAAIAKLENDELKTQEPALYQELLVQRNTNWAAKIKDMLKQPGTVFVAVGAAHLAGPDSVQAQLAKLGITVQPD